MVSSRRRRQSPYTSSSSFYVHKESELNFSVSPSHLHIDCNLSALLIPLIPEPVSHHLQSITSLPFSFQSLFLTLYFHGDPQNLPDPQGTHKDPVRSSVVLRALLKIFFFFSEKQRVVSVILSGVQDRTRRPRAKGHAVKFPFQKCSQQAVHLNVSFCWFAFRVNRSI